MKRILINATQEEELRVAIIDGQKLVDLDIEIPSLCQKKGNIYKGNIARVEPSLDAVFVEYGSGRHGFLPFKEIAESYYRKPDQPSNTSITNSLKEGQQVLIQVQREERKNKGAALTTYISLAGRYLVLMPNNARASGVSRRITGQERDEARLALEQVTLTEQEGLIVRTAGIGHSKKDLQWDLDHLRKLWDEIIKAAKGTPAPFLVYQESDIVIRSLRDHFKEDINEVIIDNQEIYTRAKEFIKMMMPKYLPRLQLYESGIPIFNHYQIESKIETAYEREVGLASGGSLVFDHTEALLTVDINSGKATKGKGIEETAFAINLEACEEIALQLRLRDVGGLIAIDFIDMVSVTNQREVETALTNAMLQDRARVQIGRISRFGLLEMSRQRLRPSLGDISHITCPRCNGNGTIRNIKSSAFAVLRMMEDEASKEKTGQVVAHLPLDVTSYILNEKRDVINDISNRHNVHLTVVPDIRMETPHFQITRYRADDKDTEKKHSYEFTNPRDDHRSTGFSRQGEKKTTRAKEIPAVSSVTPDKPAPGKSFIQKIFGELFERKSSNEQPQLNREKEASENNNQRRRRGNNRRSQNDSGRQQTRRRNYGNSNQQQRQSEQKSSDSRRNSQQNRRSPGRRPPRETQASDERSQSRRNTAPKNNPIEQSARPQQPPKRPVAQHPTEQPIEQRPAEQRPAEQQPTEQSVAERLPTNLNQVSANIPKFAKPKGLTQVETKQQND